MIRDAQARGQLLRFFGATGISATITLGLPVLLHEGLAVPPRAAVAIALTVAFMVNFLTTRLFVFRSSGRAPGELARYALTSAAFRGGEYLGFLALHALGLVYYLAQPLVLLMGSERHGLSAAQQALCDQLVAIPMRGRADSLNLAVATGVMLYELVRQGDGDTGTRGHGDTGTP